MTSQVLSCVKCICVCVCVPVSTALHRCTMPTRTRANGISSPMQTQTIFDVVCKFFFLFFLRCRTGKCVAYRVASVALWQQQGKGHDGNTQICGRRKTKYDKRYYFLSVHKRSWAHSPSHSFGPITLPLGHLSFMSSLNDYVLTYTLSLSYYYCHRCHHRSISF